MGKVGVRKASLRFRSSCKRDENRNTRSTNGAVQGVSCMTRWSSDLKHERACIVNDGRPVTVPSELETSAVPPV
jgi:hypothetical protein